MSGCVKFSYIHNEFDVFLCTLDYKTNIINIDSCIRIDSSFFTLYLVVNSHDNGGVGRDFRGMYVLPNKKVYECQKNGKKWNSKLKVIDSLIRTDERGRFQVKLSKDKEYFFVVLDDSTHGTCYNFKNLEEFH